MLSIYVTIFFLVEAECSTAKKATCLNQQCAKVNGTETCQCPTGFTLHSNGTSCIGNLEPDHFPTKYRKMKRNVFIEHGYVHETTIHAISSYAT